MQPPAHYEPYLDGLFTYCLSILCEHDAAAAALGEVLTLAERQRARLRDPALRRPWLYALARWTCLRRLDAGLPPAPRAAEPVAARRRTQLASLAWPEAAGTTPEQREALELAVRHQLSASEVGHVLGLDPDAARTLLARAACEVERTRTALAVVDSGRCAVVARLAGDPQVLLGTALRGELVRHVDECVMCRVAAERVVASEPWPGVASDATAVLAVVEAPRAAAYAVVLDALAGGTGRGRRGVPGFDRRGFPVYGEDRAARRARLRHRAVTTTVVAAVVAAPALAVWAAYRATALREDGAPAGAGRASVGEPDSPLSDGTATGRAAPPSPAAPGSPRPGAPGPSGGPGPGSPPAASVRVSAPSAAAAGSWIAVAARGASGGRTLVTLTAEGGAGAGPGAVVRWTATSSAGWLRLSAAGGELRVGESVTLVVAVDHSVEPAGSWSARITFSPGGAAVLLRGTAPRPADPTPTASPSSPTASPSGSPSPSPSGSPSSSSSSSPTVSPSATATPSPS